MAWKQCLFCNASRIGPKHKGYSLKSWQGIPKYFHDYSTLLTFGLTGNLAATFLGGYDLEYTATGIDCPNGALQVKFVMLNESTMASLSHVPVIGYTDWWKENVGKPLNETFAAGPGSLITQTATWTEQLHFPGNSKCDSTKSSQPDLGPKALKELDTNPARGTMNRAKILAERKSLEPKPHSASESPASLFDDLLRALDHIDKMLLGDATQSFGLFLTGAGGDSKSSTATKPSKDVIYLNDSGWDLTVLLEVADMLSVALASRSEMFMTWKKFKEGPVEALFEFTMKVKEAREKLGKETGATSDSSERLRDTATQLLEELRTIRTDVAQTADTTTLKPIVTPKTVQSPAASKPVPVGATPVKPAQGKVETGQWVDYDASGNMYIMIKYSDGSKRFVFASIFGSKDISNPGPMKWRRVR
jgi:hypothetical protein